MLFHYPPEILLCTSGFRTVIIGEVKVGNTVVERSEAHLLHIGVNAFIPEIMPQTE